MLGDNGKGFLRNYIICWRRKIMMKNGIKLIAAFMLVAGTACAEPIVKKLPEPVLEGGHPLMEVFKERKTVRNSVPVRG